MDRPDFNIAEIAWASGYSTKSYFNRLFLRQMGPTPRQYRASSTRNSRSHGRFRLPGMPPGPK
jgi:AraC-like DNA-binding protein